MTVEEVNHILSDHLLWLNDQNTGKRADFSGWNLSGFDLSWANLAGASLADANLSGANLSHADLSGAILTGAQLAGTNLTGANLDGAQYDITELEKAGFESKPTPRKAKQEEGGSRRDEEKSDEVILDKSDSSESIDGLLDGGGEVLDADVLGGLEDSGIQIGGVVDLEEEVAESAPPEPEKERKPGSPPKLQFPSVTGTGAVLSQLPEPESTPGSPPQPNPQPQSKRESNPDSGDDDDRSVSEEPRRKRSSPLSAMGSKISGIFKKEEKEVSVSSFVPGKIVREEPFTIQCWVYWESAREEVTKRAASSGHASEAGAKSGLVIEKGALVELSIKPVNLLDVAGQSEPQTKTIRWEGFPSDEEFVFVWPGDAPEVIYETVEISVEGIPLGDCTLCLRIDQDSSENVVSEFKRIRRAFVSYAHDDSQRVLASVQAFETVTNVDLFLDIDDLRAGVDWEDKLRNEVSSRDALFLYWSEHAAESEWVDREWRLALAERGVSYIKPMPLDPIAPPEELAQLQFADKWSRLAEYQRLKDAAGS